MLHSVWFFAVQNGYTAMVREIILSKKVPINMPDSYGGTALHVATFYRRSDILDLLLSEPDINVNASIGNSGLTPLMLAAQTIYHFEKDHKTSLPESIKKSMYSTLCDSTKIIIRKLLAAGASPYITDIYGYSAIQYAFILKQDKEICSLLKEKINKNNETHSINNKYFISGLSGSGRHRGYSF